MFGASTCIPILFLIEFNAIRDGNRGCLHLLLFLFQLEVVDENVQESYYSFPARRFITVD